MNCTTYFNIQVSAYHPVCLMYDFQTKQHYFSKQNKSLVFAMEMQYFL